MNEPSDEEKAYHEAGHALIAHTSTALRLKKGGHISIIDGEDEFGGVDVEPDPNASVNDCRLIYETGIVAAAGWAAQRRHLLETGQDVDEPSLRLGAAADLKSLVNMLGSGVFYELATIAELRFNESNNWGAVQRLAKELVNRRTITAMDAEIILDL